MTSLRSTSKVVILVAAGAVAITACSSPAPPPADQTTSSATASPATTIALSEARILAALRMPVLEPFSATYLYGSPASRLEITVSQDADLNVSFTQTASGELRLQVVMHNGVVYARFFDSQKFGEDALRDIGFKSGEWFPYEQWRELGYRVTEDVTFPCENEWCAWSEFSGVQTQGLDLLPYEARVPASLAYGLGVATPDKSCIRLNRDILFQGSSSPEFARRIFRSDNGRWIITGPCEYSVGFDEKSRITSLSNSDDGSLDPDSQDKGLLTVAYAAQPAIAAPDISWFAANKPAVKEAIQAAVDRQKAFDAKASE
jgi:hypothetical protein